MRKTWYLLIGMTVMGSLAVCAYLYLQPHTIATIEPGRINAYGVIDGLAPGSNIAVHVKANNPNLLNTGINLVYVKPEANYILTRNPFNDREELNIPIIYEPAPPKASEWFTIETDTGNWGIVELYPYQSKALPFNISIPSDVQLPKNWYFIIENRDANEGGLVVTRQDCLVLINMR